MQSTKYVTVRPTIIELRSVHGAKYAQIMNGALIIPTRHHGNDEQNCIAILDLVRLCYGEDATIVRKVIHKKDTDEGQKKEDEE
jgi:hypothetical protein